MSVADAFKSFLENLAVDNGGVISKRYGEITATLNKAFRSTDSKTDNCLQVGSYGRWTAIKGISDLDMLYIMPAKKWEDYRSKGQYKLLKATADAIANRYPTTNIKVDRLVVQVLFEKFSIEVQPVFELTDGSFRYPDTYNDGTWKITKPREEIAAMTEFDHQKNNNFRRLCKMVRSWKNKHGVGMGGLLIDTLVHNFFQSTSYYDDKSYLYYDYMSRDFFSYLSSLPERDYYLALGSNQRVKVKKKFQKKAEKTYNLCLKAIEAEKTTRQNTEWKKIYGRPFPAQEVEFNKINFVESMQGFKNTEEFFEDKFSIDVRFNIKIECEVSQDGFRPHLLTDLLRGRVWLKKKKMLRFFVKRHDIVGPFRLYWKVTNRGPEAIRRNCIRGQIVEDGGKLERKETTNFYGDHVVECVAVQNGVVIATDRIHVPIE